MARQATELASRVVRQYDGKLFVGRFISLSRNAAADIVAQIQAAGVAARLTTLHESEAGLPNRYVAVVQNDDDMTVEELAMWKQTAEKLSLPLLSDLEPSERPDWSQVPGEADAEKAPMGRPTKDKDEHKASGRSSHKKAEKAEK